MTAHTVVDAHLGVDLGTSSVKVLLVDQHGQHLAQAECPYAVHQPESGWSESVPADWWSATVMSVRGALSKAPTARPASIGLSGQMHGVVPTRDDRSAARNAILWADSRAHAQLDTYRRLPADARRRLANPLSPGMA